MDAADPEGKRPYPYPVPPQPHHQRLSHHHQPEQPVGAQSQPYSLPPPPPQPQSHPQHPSSRPSTEPHSAAHYPPAPSPYHENYLHDPNSSRNLPAPPVPSSHGYGAARPGLSSTIEAPHRLASDPYHRPPSTPSQGNPQTENSLRPIQVPNPAEAPRPEGPPMNHSPFLAGPSPEHSSGGYNGFPISHHDHASASVSYSPHPYAPGHGPPPPYQYAPNSSLYGVGAKKKQVRATQACDVCRQRKQKCNEERPCAFCSETGLKCEYREVPPPKYWQDRSMIQLMDKLSAMADSQLRMEEHIRQESRDVRRRLESLEHALKIQQPESLNHSTDARSPTVDMDVEIARNPSAYQGPSSAVSSKPVPRVETESDTPSTFLAGTGSTATLHQIQSTNAEDEFFVPTKHTTGAHNMLKWPILQQLINLDDILPKDVNPKEQYPQQLEIRRGLLKLYGRGEGPRHGDRGGDIPGTPNVSEIGDDTASISSASTDSTWGIAFHGPFSVDSTSLKTESDMGGLNPDGTLKLDRATVSELYHSFLDNVWCIHPCIPKEPMQRLIKSFIYMYSHDSGPYNSQSPFTINHDSARPDLPFKKRKRSHGGVYVAVGPGSPEGLNQRSRLFPERSINNALVLLILALGKISADKRPVPPFPGEGKEQPPRSALGESPSVVTKSSPGSISSFQSPNPDTHQLTPRSRTASTDGYAQSHQRGFGRRNFDVIPGLAYYAYATDILGNLHGGNDTSHAQAYILAAIYSAQLARVMDSWAWLTQATRACQILVQTDRVVDDISEFGRDPENRDSRQESIRFLYWSCLQLESDILAELDALSASGLYFFESKIWYPKGVVHDMPESEEVYQNTSELMLHYSGQIHIRRVLNQLHKTNFYKPGASQQSHQVNGGDTNHGGIGLEWEGAETPEGTYARFKRYLDGWKGVLPPSMQWDEEKAPLATDIKNARLRAKYYGARYVLNRPFLLQAINPYGVREKHFIVSEAMTLEAAETCVAAAIRSTVAFDGLGNGLNDRLITTNIFGTAHAQFGNCLLLAATHKSSRLSHLVKRYELNKLLDRTIRFLTNYEQHSPTLMYDKRILEHLRDNLDKPIDQPISMSASSSFDSNP